MFMVVLVRMYWQFYSMFVVVQRFIGQILLYVKDILGIEIRLIIMFFLIARVFLYGQRVVFQRFVGRTL
jgi:hypothetical protein